MKTLKNTSIFVCMAMCVIFVVLNGCRKQEEDIVSTQETSREYPSQEGWDSEIYLSRAGRLQAVVRYGHMMKFDRKKIYMFNEGVEVDFYDKDGNHASQLTSNKGEYHEGTEDVVGMGNVVVESDSGLTLRTEELRWDNRRGKIVSDTLVMLTTPQRDTLYGVGFESNADLSRRVIRKPWGVSDESVDFKKIEESFSEKSSQDTSAVRDSTRIMNK